MADALSECENSVAPLSIEFRCAFVRGPRSLLKVASILSGVGLSSATVRVLMLVYDVHVNLETSKVDGWLVRVQLVFTIKLQTSGIDGFLGDRYRCRYSMK